MCKYCEKLEDRKQQEALYEDPDVIIQVAQDTPIGRRVGSSSLDILVGEKVRYVQIFYCPMCGRKLNYATEQTTLDRDASDDQDLGGLKNLVSIKDSFMKLDAATRAGIVMEMYPGEEFHGVASFLIRAREDSRLEYLRSKIEEKEGKI